MRQCSFVKCYDHLGFPSLFRFGRYAGLPTAMRHDGDPVRRGPPWAWRAFLSVRRRTSYPPSRVGRFKKTPSHPLVALLTGASIVVRSSVGVSRHGGGWVHCMVCSEVLRHRLSQRDKTVHAPTPIVGSFTVSNNVGVIHMRNGTVESSSTATKCICTVPTSSTTPSERRLSTASLCS